MGPCIYLEERVLGQDVGFDLKVFGLRNWKDGSGIAQDGEKEGRTSLRGKLLGMLTLRCPFLHPSGEGE